MINVYYLKKDPNNRWFFVFKASNYIELVSRTYCDEKLLKQGIFMLQKILSEEIQSNYKINQNLNHYVLEFYDDSGLLICLSKNYKSRDLCEEVLKQLIELKGDGQFESMA